MTSRWVLALALALAATAHAQSPAVLGDVEVAGDTDGFHATRLRTGVLEPYRSAFDHVGVAVQTTRYSQDDWHRQAAGIVGVWRDQDPSTLAGIDALAGFTRVAGHTRAIGDVTVSLRPATDTGVEFIGAGDVVATRKAIERGVAYGFVGTSVEHTFGERLTVIGLAAYQPFTDGNERVHWRARLIYVVAPEYGVNVQARWRQYESSRHDVDGAYFNPDRYRQWQGAIAVRRRIAGWIVGGSFGAGRETINGTDSHPVRVAELRAEGALGEHTRLVLHASYSRTTGFVDAADYAYREVGVTVIRTF
jgi:hypothetical protein